MQFSDFANNAVTRTRGLSAGMWIVGWMSFSLGRDTSVDRPGNEDRSVASGRVKHTKWNITSSHHSVEWLANSQTANCTECWIPLWPQKMSLSITYRLLRLTRRCWTSRRELDPSTLRLELTFLKPVQKRPEWRMRRHSSPHSYCASPRLYSLSLQWTRMIFSRYFFRRIVS